GHGNAESLTTQPFGMQFPSERAECRGGKQYAPALDRRVDLVRRPIVDEREHVRSSVSNYTTAPALSVGRDRGRSDGRGMAGRGPGARAGPEAGQRPGDPR